MEYDMHIGAPKIQNAFPSFFTLFQTKFMVVMGEYMYVCCNVLWCSAKY